MSSFVDKLTFFYLGIMILAGNVQSLRPFFRTKRTQAGVWLIRVSKSFCSTVTVFYVCLVLCNSVQVATHKVL